MGGFLGIGNSGAAGTDRGNILSGIQSQWDIFGRGLGLSGEANTAGQQQQKQGTQNLTNATDYWNRQLSAGRTSTAQTSAPALNEAIAGGDAARQQQAQFGTGRSGGTAAGNQTAATKTQSDIDNIINQNLVGGRKEAAAGLAGVGSEELNAGSASLQRALAALGLSGESGSNVANIAGKQYQYDTEQQKQQGAAAGKLAAQIALAFL